MRPLRVPVLKGGVIIVVVVQIVCGGFVLVPCFGVFFWCPLSFSNSSYKRECSGHTLKQ